MFGLFKKMFIGLLTSIVNELYKMCIVEQSEINDSTDSIQLVSLHLNEYSQYLHYYSHYLLRLD